MEETLLFSLIHLTRHKDSDDRNFRGQTTRFSPMLRSMFFMLLTAASA